MSKTFSDGPRRILIEMEVREEYRKRFRTAFFFAFFLISIELLVIAILAFKLYTRGCQ